MDQRAKLQKHCRGPDTNVCLISPDSPTHGHKCCWHTCQHKLVEHIYIWEGKTTTQPL